MKKILVANRGEIASRIIRTCKKMGIETVAIYSEVDKDLPYVHEADNSVCIGAGPVSQSYLKMDEIIQIALSNQVDAIHPGYGLLSENHEFAQKVINHGLIFIGPTPETILSMGDKINARQIMKSHSIPVVSGSQLVQSEEEVLNSASEIGYPVMLKASSGGGGVGMVICENDQELLKAYSSVKKRAKLLFGNDHIFIEKYIKNARHIEVQIIGDQFGNIIHLFERDCSVQRRNQKVIEETHSPSLSDSAKCKMYEAALLAAKAVSYVNAGTVEFIVDEDENFYFLEMNTRLQVEHPITEKITGIDLVEWQIRIAQNEPLAFRQEDLKSNGHAIEFRVYAEDPVTFFPSPGKIENLKWGEGNVRIDTGYEEGNQVSHFYDPLIAKCIVSGETRNECLNIARRFFETTRISGIKTNIPLFNRILESPEFLSGDYSTNILKTLN